MKTGNSMQLKAVIKNKAAQYGVSAQSILQNYVMERLLERISLSEYRDKFIIKGGFLLSSIIGIDKRTTMDIDTTAKKLDVTHENLKKVFNEICVIEVDDDIRFELTGTSDIREADDYPGIRIHIIAQIEKDRNLENIWNSYREKFNYAGNISFKQTTGVVEKLMDFISNSEAK